MENVMVISNEEYGLVQRFENATPEEILGEMSYSNGSTNENFEVLEQIRNYNLPNSVLNVLIYFSLIVCGTRMSKSFMEKVAIDWTRKKIKTPMEAMEISKLQNRKYREWAKIAEEDREDKHPLQLNKVESTKFNAIELAASSSSMSDGDLGKFVREMLKTN